MPCFTPGTRLATPRGERLVEDLRAGDRLITRDHGIRALRWVGRRRLSTAELARHPHLRPILIRTWAFTALQPEHDMMVSPNTRLWVNRDRAALYFEAQEALIAAKHLVGQPGICQVEPWGVTYLHLIFDRHQIVLADGVWAESLRVHDLQGTGVGNAQRIEIAELFPGLHHSTVPVIENPVEPLVPRIRRH